MFVVWVCWLALPVAVHAQAERHELGRRLRAFEEAFEATKDEAARKRAMPYMNKAVQGFFAGKIELVGQSLDQARHALHSTEAPSVAVQWADSLWLKPEKRFLAGDSHVELRLDRFYKTTTSIPKDARLRLYLVAASVGQPPAKPLLLRDEGIDALPATLLQPLGGITAGDYRLHYEIHQHGQTLAQGDSLLSLTDKLGERMQALRDAVEKNGTPTTTDATTLQHLTKLLTALEAGRAQETDYPAHRLLAEAEALRAALQAGKPFYGPQRSGQFWLAVPTGRTSTIVRTLIPKEAAEGKPLPVVLALHGAGGSENLFFDGYGNGKLVKLCQERGWLLVAPRSSLGRQNLPELIDALAKLYPIDKKRVFVVGHSMGAGQALAAVMENPDRFAAIAALGGGGRVRPVQGIEQVPFFIGIGTQDFAYNSVRGLRTALEKAGVKQVKYKEYPEIEHMVIVQVALADVVAFFAQVKLSP
jgi:predicted esterase